MINSSAFADEAILYEISALRTVDVTVKPSSLAERLFSRITVCREGR